MPFTIAASRAFASGTMSASRFRAARFECDRQHAFHRPNRASQCKFADKTEFLEFFRIDFFAHRDHAERDRQIETGPFFLNVGRREIDRGAATRPAIATVHDRSGNAIAAFLHRRVG